MLISALSRLECVIEYLLSSPMCTPAWGILASWVRPPHRQNTSLQPGSSPYGTAGVPAGGHAHSAHRAPGGQARLLPPHCNMRRTIGDPPGDVGAPFGPSDCTHRCPPWRQRCYTPPHYRLLPGCRFGPLIYIPVAPCCSCRGSQGAQGVPADQPRQGQDYFPVA